MRLFDIFLTSFPVKRRRNELEELATWHVKDSAYMKPEEAVRAAHDSASVWDNKLGSFTQALGERVKQRKRQARDGVRQTINSFMDEDEEGDANSLSGDPISEYKGGFGEGGPNEKRRKRKDDDEPFESKLRGRRILCILAVLVDSFALRSKLYLRS